MSGHTPGPWAREGSFVVAYGDRGGNICAISEPRASDWVEYSPPQLGSEDGEERRANARLIAAAPRLLGAACELIYLVYGEADYTNEQLEDAFYQLGRAAQEADADLVVHLEEDKP